MWLEGGRRSKLHILYDMQILHRLCEELGDPPLTSQVKIHTETGVGARNVEKHFKAIDFANEGDGQYKV